MGKWLVVRSGEAVIAWGLICDCLIILHRIFQEFLGIAPFGASSSFAAHAWPNCSDKSYDGREVQAGLTSVERP